jgi:subtilisin family serine protease
MLRIVLTALSLLTFGSAAWGQVSAALSQKSGEAAEIVSLAQRDGSVRVIVMFDSPVPASEIRPDSASLAAVKARVAAAQDLIISSHFGSATNPAPGSGFERGLTRFEITPGFAISVTTTELEALAADPRVVHIQYDRPEAPLLIQSVPLIGMPNAYAAGATGQGQAVAVIDTGVQANHEFLAGKVIAEACFSFANGAGGATRVTLCPNGTPTQIGPGAANAETAQCINGTTELCDHGTHVAGIAAGLNTNQQAGEPPNGVAKNASIFAIQVFTRFNSSTDCSPNPAPCVLTFTSDMVRALDHVFSNLNSLPGGVKVASTNMSIGGGLFSSTCDSDARKPSIDNLRNAGVLSAIAAGNDGSTSQISAPGCISTATTVGSTTKSDIISSFSNMSSVVDLMAPGSSILSSIPVVPHSTTTYAFFNGTSMATPHVAGAIAAIRTACPAATASAIEGALINTGKPILDSRSGGSITKPRIQVDLAVQSLNCAAPPPPPPTQTCTLASQFGDFNGDGRDDILFRRPDGLMVQYFMNGFQVAAAQVLGAAGAEWTLTAVADFNGDGRADLLFRRGDGQLSIYLLNGSQFLGAQLIGGVDPSFDFVGAGDFNGDGRADILFRRGSDGRLALFLINGFQVIGSQAFGAAGPEWRVRGVGDFNGDGRADIVMRRSSDGLLAIYLMNGLQSIGAAVFGGPGPEFSLVGTRDFNGDSRADLVFRRNSDGLLGLVLMNGFQVLGAQLFGGPGPEFTLLGLGDLNGDGRSDFVFRRVSDGLIGLILMNGFQPLGAQFLFGVGTEFTACYGQPPLSFAQAPQ